MTRDQIIQWAREAELAEPRDDESTLPAVYVDALERFALLARADERERCAQIIDANIEQCYPDGALYEVLLSNAAAIRSRKDEE